MVKTKKTAETQKKPVKEYNPYLDILKGFTILLVVLGHSIQSYAANGAFDQNILFRIIYSFHMPLFMFLAGAAAAYSFRAMNFDFLKRKGYMLVIPFIAWGVVAYFYDGTYHNVSFPDHMYKLFYSPDYGLWFLWVLFLNFCVLALVEKLRKWLYLYAYLIVWLVIFSIPTGHWGIGLVKWHFPFFALGYLIYRYRNNLVRWRLPVLTLCVISAPILMLTWHRLYYPSFVTGLDPRLTAHGLQTITLGALSNINVYQTMVLVYTYLVPLSAIGFIYWFFHLKPLRYVWPALAFLGLYTLDIYVLSANLLRFHFGHGWVRIISAFIMATALSLLIGIYLLRRVNWLSILFLGGRTKPAALSLKK